MIVVVAIVGVLAAAAQPLWSLQSRRHQELELRQSLRTLRGAIDAYKQATVDGRVVRADAGSGYPPSLQVLVNGAADAASPKERKIYFLRRLPRDPFADPSLPAAQTWALRSYDSPPEAPREGSDVFDIHSRSDAVGLDGTKVSEW